MTETRDQRRAAAEFYYKPSGITGRVQDWIDTDDGEVDPDVRDLATLLAQREAAAVAAASTAFVARQTLLACGSLLVCEACEYEWMASTMGRDACPACALRDVRAQIAAAVAAERERCARVVEGSVGPLTDPDAAGALAFAAHRIRRPAPGEGE